ncbi:hypothetical protein QE369_003467 [Agrobacterium larrymoorei]|uniref:Uncharacterized protein n=1 Tax=Agrobacterium larrymoorei TaxID=160699 RepID=A0AAJ2ESK1_9HYPH|nr:hypothetical protein [Agrobacterium larrymoorei]MDR6103270.1 hypothetical protein [Agrobacterium larrymoorei]
MSPEENRDRTRTQAGSSVKQTAYEATSRGSGVNPKNPTQDGQRLPVFKSFIEQERDWANHYLNLSNNERILTEHPMLCSWVQVPKNAEAAKGELRELTFWERLSNGYLKHDAIELGEEAWEFLAETRGTGDVIELSKGVFGSGAKKIGTITEGLGQVIYTPPGSNDAPGEEAWLNFISERLQSTGEWMQTSSEETFRARDKFKDSWARQAGELIGDELPNFAVSKIPVAGAFLAPVVDGFANAGESASNARRAGADENAQTSAARSGFLLGALELPVDNLIEGKEEVEDGKGEKDRKAGKGWRRLGAELLFKATWTGAKDIAKKTGQNAIAIDYYKPDQKLDDGLLQAGVNGVAKSVMFQGIPKVVNKAFGQPQPRGGAEQPEAAGQTLTEISDHASSSEVRARHPEEFGDYLRVVTKDTPIETIHIEGKKFSDVFRNSGDDAGKAFGSLPGFDQAQLNVAIPSGGDVKLSLSTYATHLAGGKHDSALLPHMRFDPRAKTLAEWRALKASESERSARSKSDAEVARAAEDRNQTVAKQERQQEVQRLQASGVPPEQAQSSAVALDATRGVRSAKAGQTREDYSRENPPADASSINQGQPSSVNGAAGQAAASPVNASESVNGSRTAAQPPVSNDPSLKVEGPESTPVWTPPQTPSSTAPNQSAPAEQLKATLQSSTAPAVQIEQPSSPPKVLGPQGPAVPTETPWSARRDKLNRNGR